MPSTNVSSQYVTPRCAALRENVSSFATKKLGSRRKDMVDSIVTVLSSSDSMAGVKTLTEIRNAYQLSWPFRVFDSLFYNGREQRARDDLLILTFTDIFQWLLCSDPRFSSGDIARFDEILSVAMSQMECFNPTSTLLKQQCTSIKEYAAHALDRLYQSAHNPSAFLSLFDVKAVTFERSDLSGKKELQAQVSLTLIDSTCTDGKRDLSLSFGIAAKDWLNHAFCKAYISDKGVEHFASDKLEKYKGAEKEYELFESSRPQASVLKEDIAFSQHALSIELGKESCKYNDAYNRMCHYLINGEDTHLEKEISSLNSGITALLSSQKLLIKYSEVFSKLLSSHTEKAKSCKEMAEQYNTYVGELSRVAPTSTDYKIQLPTRLKVSALELETETASILFDKVNILVNDTSEQIKKHQGIVKYFQQKLDEWLEAETEYSHSIVPSVAEFNEKLTSLLDSVYTDYFETEAQAPKPYIIRSRYTGTGSPVQDYEKMIKLVTATPKTKSETILAVEDFLTCYLTMTQSKRESGSYLPDVIRKISKALSSCDTYNQTVVKANAELIQVRERICAEFIRKSTILAIPTTTVAVVETTNKKMLDVKTRAEEMLETLRPICGEIKKMGFVKVGEQLMATRICAGGGIGHLKVYIDKYLDTRNQDVASAAAAASSAAAAAAAVITAATVDTAASIRDATHTEIEPASSFSLSQSALTYDITHYSPKTDGRQQWESPEEIKIKKQKEIQEQKEIKKQKEIQQEKETRKLFLELVGDLL